MPDSKCGCIAVERPIRLAILTLSDTRSESDDRSGDAIVESAKQSGHEIVERGLIRDEPDPLEDCLKRWTSASAKIDAIITTGGTGLAKRDQTIDVVRRWLDAELPGFGERFRAVSFDEVGPSAMLSRAVAGRIGSTMIFCLPGSTGGVRTGMDQCVLPILSHAVGLVSD